MSNQPKPNLDSIHDLLFGASRALTLKLALEANLFTCIANGNHSARTLAAATECSETGIGILADALCAMGFVLKDAQHYRLTAHAETFLVKGKSTYYGDSYLDAILPWAWSLNGPALDAIRTGDGVGKSITGADSEALWWSWAEAHAVFWEEIADAARAMWDAVSAACPLPPAANILDIACGHAIWTLVLLQRNPDATLTGVDRHPKVLGVANRVAEEMGVSSRLTTAVGDIAEYEVQRNAYDIVYIGGVLYLYHGEQAIEILLRAHRALKPGAALVVNTLIADPERSAAQGPLIQALRRCLYDGGGVHTFAEYQSDLIAAGFGDVEPIDDSLIVARKGMVSASAP